MKPILIFQQASNPISLRFQNKILEKQFQKDYINRYLRQIQMAQILATILYASAVGSEILIFSLDMVHSYIRLFVVVISFIIGFLLTILRTGFYKKYYKAFNVYYVLITGLSFIHAGYNAPEDYSFVIYSGLFVSLVFNYAFIRQDFITSSLTGFMLLLAYMLTAFNGNSSFEGTLHISMYFIVFNFVGMFIAYLIEYENKKNFLMMNKINTDAIKIQEANKNLEQRVNERTEELLIAKNKAEESDRLKSAFLMNMSHEIRTPMNSILGFTDLLKGTGLTSTEQQNYIEIIINSGNRLLNTVNNIIDISKIETGLVTPKIRSFDIVEKLNNIFNSFSTEALNKEIKLIFDKTNLPEQLICETDSSLFDSIITNLLNNAIKFTRKGSVELGLTIEESNLKFYVRDTGIGIPNNRQEAVFERFVQADVEDKSVYEGSGIGLAITKSYIEMLGGKIWLKSKEGEGSVFFFTLPIKSSSINPPIKEKTNIEIKTNLNKKPTILIVDDDIMSARLLQVMLQPYALNIYTAKTGKEAIDMYKLHSEIDIILMDIKMPVMGGHMATKKIREFDPDVIILAQTAFAMPDDYHKALSAGCNDYISKPINKERLLELIHKYV